MKLAPRRRIGIGNGSFFLSGNSMDDRSQPLKAALWMTGAVVSFSAMAVAGREVSIELDTFELMMYRSLIGIVIVLAVGAYSGTLNQVRADKLPLHFVRNLFHFTGQNLWFYAVTLIPFAQLFALEFTVPLWVAILAPLVLGERMTRARILAAGLGFVGILLVARPGAAEIGPGIIAAALSALGFAGSVMATKGLSRTQTTMCIMFWLVVMQTVFGIVCSGYDGDIALPSMTALPWVAIVAFGGLLAHYCLTTALQLAPATVVAPLDFARLPLIAVVGMVFYGEALEIAVFAGAGLIFAANYLNIRAEQRRI
jgi:drug/metabolite transporter (DMT)-like permease